MANPTALSRFKPYASGQGPESLTKKVSIFTNLAGDAVRFSMQEDLGDIVPTATLTMLNAHLAEIGVFGGVTSDDDIATYGKEIPDATVQPNQSVYVTEILGEYNITGNDEYGNPIYAAKTETDQVCTTHWRIVSASLALTDAGIPTCDISLESTAKIVQECKINSKEMGSPANTFQIIEGTYLDSIFYYHNLYADQDGYTGIASLADLLDSFLNGRYVTTTTSDPYPNTNPYFTLHITSPLMKDGNTYSGATIQGIAKSQAFFKSKGYNLGTTGPDNDGIDGIYGTLTKAAVLAYQKKVFPNDSSVWTGQLGKVTWPKMFPSSTTVQYIPPTILLVVIRGQDTVTPTGATVTYYNDYCDIFFKRIEDMGFVINDGTDDGMPFSLDSVIKRYFWTLYGSGVWTATKIEKFGLRYIPLYTTYTDGGNVWEIIQNIFAFNGLNLRFRRDKSMAIWQADNDQLLVIDDTIDVGEYDVGLTLSYTKEGVINKASVKGWIGNFGEGEVIPDPTYVPPSVTSTTGSSYPNKVYLQYPGVSGYTCNGFMRDDYACHGITGVHSVQVKLISKGYSCGSQGHDGIYGPDTKAAVHAFQTKVGIQHDGIVGPQTWKALFPPTTTTTVSDGQMTYKQANTELSKIRGVTIDPGYGYATPPAGVENTPATIHWLFGLYPQLSCEDPALEQAEALTWDLFTIIVNKYYATLQDIEAINYWIPDSKEQHTVEAFSPIADMILNIDGNSRYAVEGEFEVDADYLLTDTDALVNWGKREIFKTVILARTGSYSSQNIPLRAEVGMKITGTSTLTGTTTMLIVNLSRTTDAQQQTCETQISGNLTQASGVNDTWVD